MSESVLVPVRSHSVRNVLHARTVTRSEPSLTYVLSPHRILTYHPIRTFLHVRSVTPSGSSFTYILSLHQNFPSTNKFNAAHYQINSLMCRYLIPFPLHQADESTWGTISEGGSTINWEYQRLNIALLSAEFQRPLCIYSPGEVPGDLCRGAVMNNFLEHTGSREN